MNKKQVIEKNMEEYSKYGLNRIEIDAGRALFNSAISEVKAENPNANDKDIADGIEYIGIDTLKDSLEDINFALLGKVKESMLQSAKQYVDKNS